MPHARNPRVGLFTKPRIVMGRFPHGVDFGAPDGEKVFLFFLICPTNAFVHMRLLAKIAKMLHVPNIIQRFKEASGKTDIIRILLEVERIRFVTRDA
ncbi:MAG: PTS sugar transporter subunit IIA [Candidatus Omnitrophota bacterium]